MGVSVPIVCHSCGNRGQRRVEKVSARTRCKRCKSHDIGIDLGSRTAKFDIATEDGRLLRDQRSGYGGNYELPTFDTREDAESWLKRLDEHYGHPPLKIVETSKVAWNDLPGEGKCGLCGSVTTSGDHGATYCSNPDCPRYDDPYESSKKTAAGFMSPGYYVLGRFGGSIIDGPFSEISLARQALVNQHGGAVQYLTESRARGQGEAQPFIFPEGYLNIAPYPRVPPSISSLRGITRRTAKPKKCPHCGGPGSAIWTDDQGRKECGNCGKVWKTSGRKRAGEQSPDNPDYHFMYGWPADRKRDVCRWCHQPIVDAGPEAGAPKGKVDWATDATDKDGDPVNHSDKPAAYMGGDYGCDNHPISGEDGVGPHETEEDLLNIVRKHHLGSDEYVEDPDEIAPCICGEPKKNSEPCRNPDCPLYRILREPPWDAQASKIEEIRQAVLATNPGMEERQARHVAMLTVAHMREKQAEQLCNYWIEKEDRRCTNPAVGNNEHGNPMCGLHSGKTALQAHAADYDAYRVGAIWYTRWGYDQTNVEFFEVVRETGASVVLRRIKSEVHDGRRFPSPGEYTVDFSLQGNPGTPARIRDEGRGYSETLCRKRDVGSRPMVRIDDVRSAWPYEGDGQYDTDAAGLPGH